MWWASPEVQVNAFVNGKVSGYIHNTVSYPALRGGASCLIAPPCLLNPRTGRGGIERSSTAGAPMEGVAPTLLFLGEQGKR